MSQVLKPGVALEERLAALDIYRGLAMFLMMAEVLHLPQVASAFEASSIWQTIKFHTTHVGWVGCSLHDMIQPSFTFLVGAALPYSLAARARKGQSARGAWLHAAWRALVLVGLGIFLRSIGRAQTYFTFEDTLTQIGLGYVFAYLLGRAAIPVVWLVTVAILLGYWGWFAMTPIPAADSPMGMASAAKGLPELRPFEQHWQIHTNAAEQFDQWFLNLFPREAPFERNNGGYCTLSFIPTLATMLLGLLAGRQLHESSSSKQTLIWMFAVGLMLLGAGLAIGQLGYCPIVKRIWTPSWTLFSGGICCLTVGVLYLVADMLRFRWWAFPLVLLGCNSIAAYVIAETSQGFIRQNLATHFGSSWHGLLGEPYTPFVAGGAVLLVQWIVLWRMYANRIFVRV
jgi:heparan-alpha-glucosaminide N-acetyltransferase